MAKLPARYLWKNHKASIEARCDLIPDLPADIRKAIMKIEKGANSARNAMFHGVNYAALCYEPYQRNFEEALGFLGHKGYRENFDMTPEQKDRWAFWIRYCEIAKIEPDSCFEDWMA